MWGEHEGMGWWMVFGAVWFALFWGAIIWLVVHLLGLGRDARGRDGSAIEIARRRYASGEITREEFEQIRRDLES